MVSRVSLAWRPLVIFGTGLLARIGLIQAYPAIFGSDSITRLVHQDRVFIVYQLPALQASLVALGKISADPALARYWMALLGALAGLAFYYLAGDLLEPEAGFAAGLLFVFQPFLLAHSTVPYQEIVMLGALAAAFHFYFTGRPLWTSLALGLACLTRYEAWLACPVLIFPSLAKKPFRVSAALRALAWYGWAPLAWMVWRAGLAPPGTYVVDTHLTGARLFRFAYLGWITATLTPVPVLLLGVLGLHQVWRRRLLADTRCRMLWSFLGLFLAALLFSAHGVPPDPERYVTAREAHVPMAAVILLAGLALARWPRARPVLLGLSAILGLGMAAYYLARETSEPRLQLSYRLARYLDRTLTPGQTAWILVEPVPPEGLQLYLGRVRRMQGEAGVQRARELLEEITSGPPDYERIVVHAPRVRGQLRTIPSASLAPRARARFFTSGERPDWIVVWSDFRASDDSEARLLEQVRASGEPVETIRSGSFESTIYRIRWPPGSGLRIAPDRRSP